MTGQFFKWVTNAPNKFSDSPKQDILALTQKMHARLCTW